MYGQKVPYIICHITCPLDAEYLRLLASTSIFTTLENQNVSYNFCDEVEESEDIDQLNYCMMLWCQDGLNNQGFYISICVFHINTWFFKLLTQSICVAFFVFCSSDSTWTFFTASSFFSVKDLLIQFLAFNFAKIFLCPQSINHDPSTVYL